MKALVDAVDAVTSRKREHGDLAFSSDGFAASAPKRGRKSKKGDMPREKRLEQNRLAASESRRRKKEMVEELQRSVAFFSKANISLKSQNAELERQILLAKQRILSGEKGVPSNAFKAAPAPSLVMEPSATNQGRSGGEFAKNDLSGLLKSSSGIDQQQAQAAHFAATQAMYKSMGFPPGAARAAASTFSQYVGQTGKLPGTPNATEETDPSVVSNDVISLLNTPKPVDEKQAQAAHFAATQALYKSMGFPPGAARAAASTFSQCAGQPMPAVKPIASTSMGSNFDGLSQNLKKTPTPSMDCKAPDQPSQSIESGESYVEALNKYAMRQAAAANAAAAAANAALQAAKFHCQQQSSRPIPSLPPMMNPGLHFPFSSVGGYVGGVSLSNFLSQAQGAASAERKE
ncbi:hypothetical protein HJC23_000283 [Cyclotella cryptica]|uniref:BZIP domain-containing protein n=1 Tax=Cyclotella cryptica TaxID=29204 RepID=A0ABD3QBK8_9STRA